MTSPDIYKAPEAELHSADSNSNSPYFIVSIKKLWVMSMVTMGSYLVVWNYFHWRAIKHIENSNIWPVPRAIFSIFFVFSLFNRFDASVNANGQRYAWSPFMCAAVYFIVNIVLGIFSGMTEYFEATALLIFDIPLTIVVIALTTFVTVKAQIAANMVCNDEQGQSNDRFTAANIAWMLFFLVLWALYIVSIFFLLKNP